MNLYKHVSSHYPDPSKPCKIALVEESPGIDDLCTGRALTGYLGKLLNKALRLANIERTEVFITHLFNEALPDENVQKIGVRKWDPANLDYYGYEPRRLPNTGHIPPEWDHHFDRLARELEAVDPAVILPMGSTCLWAFTGETTIGKARGAITRAKFIRPGAKVLPTFRASLVHRQYKMLGTWVNDFKKAWLEADAAADQLTLSPCTLWLAPTLEDMGLFLREYLSCAETICVDIETAKGQITDIGFGVNEALAISIPFVDYRQPNRCYWPTFEAELAAWNWVAHVLDLPQPKLFQNGPYDTYYLVKYGIKVRNYRFDTRLLQHALYPELPKDLAYMASVYCHNGPWKLLADHSHTEDSFIGNTKRDD